MSIPSPEYLRERRPLHDVRGYVASSGTLLMNGDEIEALIETFGPVLQVDLDWKDSPCFPTPYIAELMGVSIIPGTKILLNAEGNALSDELEFGFRLFGQRPKLWDMEITDGPSLNFEMLPSESGVISSGIHMTGEHEINYFHWIVEVLPRLFLCEKLLIDTEIPILVSEGLHDNLYALLDIIRAPKRAVLKLPRDRHHRVARLIYPSDLTRILDTYDRAPGKDTTYLPVALLREMAVGIKSALDATTSRSGKYIYVKRNSSYRRLLNQPDIESLLTEKGFDVVDPGRRTLVEQIRIFSQAETIVGPSGAAMANILWCRPGTRLIVLHSDHPLKKYPYWDALARVCDAQVTYLSGPRAHNITGIFETHDDFIINPSELLRDLETSL